MAPDPAAAAPAGAGPAPPRIPFVELLGARLEAFEPGRAVLTLALRDELLNSWEVAHGGVTMTLLDVAMAHAARSPQVAGGAPLAGVVTVEMKTSFMRAATGVLRAEGLRLERTATLAFCEATLFDDTDRRVAHATGTFKYLSGLAAGRGRGRIVRPGASD